MRKKRTISILLVLCIATFLCGFSFNNTSVAVDTEKNKFYRYVTADEVINAFKEDTQKASEDYKNNYYLLSGKIVDISKNGDSVSISGTDPTSMVVCKCSDKKVRKDILNFELGDSVAVFGKLVVDLIDKEQHIQIEKIITNPSSIKSANTYFLLNGDKFDANDTIEKTLCNGRVKYLVPKNFSQIEVNITENNLGTIEGYQYVLNKMPGKTNAEPEYIFVTYFDKKLLKDASDIKKSASVEKVIIENIEEQVGKFPSKEVSTYYGTDYKYYLGKYTDQLEAGRGYRTEYIFQEDAEKGIVLILYVYRDNQYLSDALFISRFLEINNN